MSGTVFASYLSMKKSIYILFIIASIGLSSCTKIIRENNYDNPAPLSLSELIRSYDLWYVDIDQTQGTGNVPFVSRAFTMSFMYNGDVMANNNIVNIGLTGNGYGIVIGNYQTNNRSGILEINHPIDGTVDFVVKQVSDNEIELHNPYENVSYLLVGYQKSHFDYDKLFYENITYFLQEYETWTKTYEDIVDPNAVFRAENHLAFFVDGNTNSFNSSIDTPNTAIANIQWDFAGTYEVYNTGTEDVKSLELRYDSNNGQEVFELQIINDSNIRLINVNTDNLYEFRGRSYIQYMRAHGRPKVFKKKIDKQHYLKLK